MVLALRLSDFVHAMRVYCSSPTFHWFTVAANANRRHLIVATLRNKRLSSLRLSRATFSDVIAYLPHSHIDSCQLVCLNFRQNIDGRARDLPVNQMTVDLFLPFINNIVKPGDFARASYAFPQLIPTC